MGARLRPRVGVRVKVEGEGEGEHQHVADEVLILNGRRSRRVYSHLWCTTVHGTYGTPEAGTRLQ